MRHRVPSSDLEAQSAAQAAVRALRLPKTRRHRDLYESPARAVAALRRRVQIAGTVVEPCNGHGAISRCFEDCRVVTNDVDPDKPADTHVDARELVLPPERPIWVCTNPPFGLAFEILRNMFDQGATIAYYVRLSFLEPTLERGPWLNANPPSGIIVDERHSFTGDGSTDSVTCAWLIFRAELTPAIQIQSPDVKLAKKAARQIRPSRSQR